MSIENNSLQCSYCGKIAPGSEEHIIPHALGGALKSSRVCCECCNNQLGEYVDAPFVKMFAPLCAKMPPLNGCSKFAGSYRVNLQSPRDPNSIVPGLIRNGMISCPELSKRHKCSARELNLSEADIVSVPLDWDNKALKNGLGKVAFEFAVHNGVSPSLMSHKINVSNSRGDVTAVDFDFPVVPFCPLNEFDKFIELKTECKLYHHLLLFCQGRMLWCYIDLFNTFQFYVLLSDSCLRDAATVEHFQYAEAMERSIPKFLHGRSPKDILIDAMTYGVEPNLNEDELDRKIAIAIQTKSVVTSSKNALKDRLDAVATYLRDYMLHRGSELAEGQSIMQVFLDAKFYFDDNDMLLLNRYRQILRGVSGEPRSYPQGDLELYSASKSLVNDYAKQKFERLCSCLNAS